MLVHRLSQLSRADLATAGGKGANLGELIQLGLAVPPGFVVSADAYAEQARAWGLAERLSAHLAASGWEAAASEAAELFERGAMLPGMEGAVRDAYRELGAPAGRGSLLGDGGGPRRRLVRGPARDVPRRGGRGRAAPRAAAVLGVPLEPEGPRLPGGARHRSPGGQHRRGGAAHGPGRVRRRPVHRRPGGPARRPHAPGGRPGPRRGRGVRAHDRRCVPPAARAVRRGRGARPGPTERGRGPRDERPRDRRPRPPGAPAVPRRATPWCSSWAASGSASRPTSAARRTWSSPSQGAPFTSSSRARSPRSARPRSSPSLRPRSSTACSEGCSRPTTTTGSPSPPGRSINGASGRRSLRSCAWCASWGSTWTRPRSARGSTRCGVRSSSTAGATHPPVAPAAAEGRGQPARRRDGVVGERGFERIQEACAPVDLRAMDDAALLRRADRIGETTTAVLGKRFERSASQLAAIALRVPVALAVGPKRAATVMGDLVSGLHTRTSDVNLALFHLARRAVSAGPEVDRRDPGGPRRGPPRIGGRPRAPGRGRSVPGRAWAPREHGSLPLGADVAANPAPLWGLLRGLLDVAAPPSEAAGLARYRAALAEVTRALRFVPRLPDAFRGTLEQLRSGDRLPGAHALRSGALVLRAAGDRRRDRASPLRARPPAAPDDVFYLTEAELRGWLEGAGAAARRGEAARSTAARDVRGGQRAVAEDGRSGRARGGASGDVLRGIGASSGVVRGKARIVRKSGSSSG